MKNKDSLLSILHDWKGLVEYDTVNKVLDEVNKDYLNKTVYPERKEVFSVFRRCNPNDVKVVIIGMSPYHDGKATGIPFANRDDTIQLSTSLELVKNKIESDIYNGFNLDFDITLESWLKQGVLLLNSAITTVRGNPNSHVNIWFKFVSEIISNLTDNKKDIIFCLWGRNAQHFKRYIKNGSIILECPHPSYFARLNEEFNCNHFIEVNEILKNSGEKIIKW